jgi:cellulose biosynthesis protein BcsQ
VSGAALLVVGAGAANLKSTVAVNLAAALAAAGRAVRLVDHDGASSHALAAALGGAPTLPWATAPITVVAPGATGTAVAASADDALTIVDPPPRLDAAAHALVAEARLVLVPVDASLLALRVLGDVEAAVAEAAGRAGAAGVVPPRLRVVLARRLPREVDRWGLVERVGRLAPDVLAPVTLPMARSARARAPEALLYAPGTAAARAYAALAALVLADLPATPPVSTTP